jgi:hypothetical protein
MTRRWGMKTLLFSGEFCRRDKCFGLYLPAEPTYRSPALELEFDASEVVRIVCGRSNQSDAERAC